MTIESLIDKQDSLGEDDEACEFCGCGLYPHEIETVDEAVSATLNIGSVILYCTNEECENYHKPVGGFSA
jgi:Zn-finger protein